MLNRDRHSPPVNLLRPARTNRPRRWLSLSCGCLLLVLGFFWWWSSASLTPAPAPEPPPTTPEQVTGPPANPLVQLLTQFGQHDQLTGQARLAQWQLTGSQLQLRYLVTGADWRPVTEFWSELPWPLSTRVTPGPEGTELQLTLQWPVPAPGQPGSQLIAVPEWPAEVQLIKLQQQPGQLQATLQGDWSSLYSWWEQTAAAGWFSSRVQWQRLAGSQALELQVQLRQTGQLMAQAWPALASPFGPSPARHETPTSPPAATGSPTAEPAPTCHSTPPAVRTQMIWRHPAPPRALVQINQQPARLTWLPATVTPDGWQLSLTAAGPLQLSHPICPAIRLPDPE